MKSTTASSLHVLATAQRRGAEVFAMELRDRLAATGRRAEALALVSGGHDSLDVPVLGGRRASVRALARLRQQAGRFDVVVAHGSSTLAACAVALTGATPFVYANIGDPRYWAGSPTRRARVRWFLSRAAAVAAISETARDVLIEHFHLAPARVVTIPNGRSPDRFRPPSAEEKAQARQRLALPDGVPVVVMLAALSDEKRIDDAVQAVAALTDARLIVAGDGPQRGPLQQLADEVAPGRVCFLGAVSAPERVLFAADVLLLTSASEGVPGALVEAGLCGLPAVCTDVGFCADVVVPGVTGALVPVGDSDATTKSLREVLANGERLGAAARHRCVERYDMGRVAEQWAGLINLVVGYSGRQ